MSERLGGVAYDRDPRTFPSGPNLWVAQHEPDYAEQTAAAIDEEVRSIVQNAMEHALAAGPAGRAETQRAPFAREGHVARWCAGARVTA